MLLILEHNTFFGKVVDPWAHGSILGGSWASKYRACQQNQAFRNTAPDSGTDPETVAATAARTPPATRAGGWDYGRYQTP